MKKQSHIKRTALCILLIVSGILWIARELPSNPGEEDEDTFVSAMWLSQFDLSPMMTEAGRQRDEADYSKRIGIALENMKQNGINTLFVQLRPNGDSLYPSSLFPSSAYAVGKTGGSFSFDPFSILLEQAQELGLSVHAWINPLRLFTESVRGELASTEEYCHLAWCEQEDGRAVLVEGTWYLNPAREEAVELIVEGVREILSRYPVDGIHIDDYFYPTTDPSFDREDYARASEGKDALTLQDFRRETINRLVSSLYRAVHDFPGNAVFGVSPSGNIQRNYEELYADVALWCGQEGYVDYICPQIYFGLEHQTHDFRSVALSFDRMIQQDDIALYLGMTLDKARRGFRGEEDPYAGSGAREWIEHQDVLARCLSATKELRHGNGVAFFSYQCLFSPTDGSFVAQTAEEWSNLLPILLDLQKK